MIFDFDPERLAAAFWAGMAGAFMGLVALSTTLFAVPPPDRRQILRAVADFTIGMFGAVVFGYALAVPAAALLNGLAAKLVPGFAAVDETAAGIIVGSFVLKGWPILLDFILKKLKDKAEAKIA